MRLNKLPPAMTDDHGEYDKLSIVRTNVLMLNHSIVFE